MKWLFFGLFTGVTLISYTACDKEETKRIPELATTEVTEILPTSAKVQVTITSNGGEEIDFYGICWSTSPNPTIETSENIRREDDSDTFQFELKGLNEHSTYYLKSFASNSIGNEYSEEVSFTTLPFDTYTVKDIDGNNYRAITIGTQDWFTENLKTTRFANGDAIPDGTGISHYQGLESYYFSYQHNPDAVEGYGRLYTWPVVIDDRNVCPDGWHVPSEADWDILINHLGDIEIAGGKLKEIGAEHWMGDNEGATNETGFSARASGYFYPPAHDYFNHLGYVGYWWSTTESDANAVHVHLSYQSAMLYKNNWRKEYCLAVRCVKD